MSEPFSLFHLLQSLLPSPPTENSENARPASEEPTIESETAESAPSKNNAFLDFAKQHDERAKRLKK
ncbi:MAG: hypothetical protein IJV85_01050 [Clostridia bacterium]|nr:hypothetical protein [Clostridia bacterium]